MNIQPKKNNGQVLRSNSGQALLLVLLSMSVVLVVALSIVSRSVTDIAISTKEESSTRAFNAAESGVERVLVTGSNLGNTPLGDANVTANVTSVGRALSSFSYPLGLVNGDSATVWLASRNASGNVNCVSPNICFTSSSVNVYWGNQATPRNDNAPALELIYYFDVNGGGYAGTTAQRVVLDPYLVRATQNNFTYAPGGAFTIGTKTYAFSHTVDLNALGNTSSSTAGTSILFKARFLYNPDPHEFGVAGPAGSQFPAQGNLIDSTGKSGDANRRLNVFQSVGDIPSVFDNVVYSKGDLTKP